MKRSGFAKKAYEEIVASRSKKKLRTVGKKGRRWASLRASLKKRFEMVGITECELKYSGCATDNYLGFAHAKKRRKLSDADLGVVILACNFCHDKIETDARMESIVLNIIQSRQIQPT